MLSQSLHNLVQLLDINIPTLVSVKKDRKPELVKKRIIFGLPPFLPLSVFLKSSSLLVLLLQNLKTNYFVKCFSKIDENLSEIYGSIFINIPTT